MVITEKIISKHIIQPSSPTPDNLRNLKLSFLDQISPPIYNPFIFFYESKLDQHVAISQLLKQSLSQILTVFYPFAGTIQENSFIDCNDTGVEFIEARVYARLSQVTKEAKMEELKRLGPRDCSFHSENSILSVKISFFDCGGIALGACLSHKIADFASFVVFMNAWAATCLGATDQVIQPSFDMAVHFPPRDLSALNYTPGATATKEKIATKRFVFDREKLERLRQQEAALGEVKNQSRVEALSAFIFKNFIEATKAKSETEKTSFAAVHAVNLRPRTIPPIPDTIYGNCYIVTFAFSSETEGASNGVSNLRAALRAIDDHYIKKVLSEKYLTAKRAIESSGIERFSFTSMWKFPVYDVDFGWGKPVWVCPTTAPYKNMVILMSTPSRDGIEAWVNYVPHEDFLQVLETNYSKLSTDKSWSKM